MKTYQEAEAAVFAPGAPLFDQYKPFQMDILRSKLLPVFCGKLSRAAFPDLSDDFLCSEAMTNMWINVLFTGLVIGMEMEKP